MTLFTDSNMQLLPKESCLLQPFCSLPVELYGLLLQEIIALRLIDFVIMRLDSNRRNFNSQVSN